MSFVELGGLSGLGGVRGAGIPEHNRLRGLDQGNPHPQYAGAAHDHDDYSAVGHEHGSSGETSVVPVGSMTAYLGSSAPDGWLICDGSAVSRETYANLFAVTSTLYGAGDGSTTFNLPDLQQAFPMGKAASGTGSSLGDTGGSKDAVVVTHSHNLQTRPDDGTSSGAWYGSAEQTTQGVQVTATDSAGVSGTDANLPPYVVVNWIVKT